MPEVTEKTVKELEADIAATQAKEEAEEKRCQKLLVAKGRKELEKYQGMHPGKFLKNQGWKESDIVDFFKYSKAS